MTKPDLVFSKTTRVAGRLARMRDGLAVPREIVVVDQQRIEQVAFNIFLAMQECVDLASHIVADEGWGTPVNLADAFTLLAGRQVISSATMLAMRRGTRLRNLIAHAYGDIDPDKLYTAATEGVTEMWDHERVYFAAA